MWKQTKELAPHLFTQLHCCGGYEPFLEDFIDAGLDSSNPVQITCCGMDPKRLKKSTASVLHFGVVVAIPGLCCPVERPRMSIAM